MTRERIEAAMSRLEALAGAATAGPWVPVLDDTDESVVTPAFTESGEGLEWRYEASWEPEAELICLLHALLPEILATLWRRDNLAHLLADKILKATEHGKA